MADKIILDREITNKTLKDLLAVRADFIANGKTKSKEFNNVLEKIISEIVEKARFLVPIETDVEPIKTNDGEICIPISGKSTFVVLTNDNIHDFIPIFSDTETYNKWEDKAENVHAITMDFPSLAIMLQKEENEGLVLNPFTDGFVIYHEMVMNWFETLLKSQGGSSSHAIPASMADQVYNLNPYPFQLSNVLCETAKKNPAIKSMWLRGINLNNEDSYLLIVDFTGDRQKAISPLGETARKFLGDKPLHIVPLDEGFGGRAAQGVSPIYTKD